MKRFQFNRRSACMQAILGNGAGTKHFYPIALNRYHGGGQRPLQHTAINVGCDSGSEGRSRLVDGAGGRLSGQVGAGRGQRRAQAPGQFQCYRMGRNPYPYTAFAIGQRRR